ncbi:MULTISPECIES: 7-carboxy-7-deazaguanine synthase QueE [Methylocaldum]|uniref:7-carboxy-7-deazaguanine synthase QueE n=1 Tax=unclassified Methylocaldum TaxID=2622260 RepID=UPI000A3241CD|nr:7-carboxy-7-deazaguanine synthase [Methylocaldum sp. RMAD-M]MVF20799.1 7-carboxy-7-deazaguanine synthase QueE [Methylocaldum sp. BRCS4]
MNQLRVTEIFYSLQGESRTVGLPTVFVRLTGCPLRCVYCDTAYAFTGGQKMSINEIVAEVGTYHPGYVTVTGGEPLAQRGCLVLLDALVEKGYEVSLETSGALDVSDVNPKVVKVLDLKTPSSCEESRNLYRNLDYLDRKDQLKFVIMNEADYQWAKAKMEEYGLSDRCEVLFSPAMGAQDPAELADKILRDRLPVRFQVQLHKILWGDTPGR